MQGTHGMQGHFPRAQFDLVMAMYLASRVTMS